MNGKIQKWTRGLAVLSLVLLYGCKEATPPASLEESFSQPLVNAAGATVSGNNLLNTEYLLLYFSAHWCPPCKAFTPKLVKFYTTHGGGKLFQVVLVSGDRNENAMYTYMRETHMPWLAMRFGSDSARSLQDIYSGDGIPRLVLLNPQGEVIADSFKGSHYLGPQHVLEELKKRLPKPEAKVVAHPEPHPPNSEPLTERFKLTGFGKSAGKRMAIINGELATLGTELDTGVRVEEIAGTYIVIAIKGQRHRLYLQAIP